VIDNAGEPEAKPVVDSRNRRIHLVRTSRNEGPAGGWSTGLAGFLSESTSDWAWLLDDDVVPSPTALEELLGTAHAEKAPIVRPVVFDLETGLARRHPSWCGPIVRREVIENCGLPMAELVWWAEDTEYFQVRLPAAGYREIITDAATVIHHGLRRRASRSPAKIYYEVRNRLWIKIYAKGQLRAPSKWWKIVRAVAVGVAHVTGVSPRIEGVKALVFGLLDGAKGTLGFRFALEEGPLQPPG
jgi:rhamnopyranosyl-N-acetylglucosaminyl-diphospho-decaprenol beta-1,3/1,4-galactofuranosyltransferase